MSYTKQINSTRTLFEVSLGHLDARFTPVEQSEMYADGHKLYATNLYVKGNLPNKETKPIKSGRKINRGRD